MSRIFSTHRTLMLSLVAVSAAWIYLLKSTSGASRKVPVELAAARLREAWADNHTTA